MDGQTDGRMDKCLGLRPDECKGGGKKSCSLALTLKVSLYIYFILSPPNAKAKALNLFCTTWAAEDPLVKYVKRT